MELNAEQIKKALECCSSKNLGCKECPLQPKESLAICVTEISKNALTLINELIGENERLQKSCTELTQELHDVAREYELYKRHNCDAEFFKVKDKIKADTAKEMHSEIKDRCIKAGIYPAFVERTINQVVNEISEETK